MKVLSLRMKDEEIEFLKEYAEINNINLSSFIRNLILDKLYDDFTKEEEKEILKAWKESKTIKSIPLEEAFKEIGI